MDQLLNPLAPLPLPMVWHLVANKTYATVMVNAGLEIQQFIAIRVAERTALGKES